MKPEITPPQLEQYRQQHIGRLLLQAHRMFSTGALQLLHQRGHTSLTQAHLALLPMIDLDGTRSIVLAQRTGLTKQAINQSIAELERLGYLHKAPDPTDGRASLVQFSDRGWAFLQDAFEVKHTLESQYRSILGDGDFEELQRALKRLTTQLQADQIP